MNARAYSRISQCSSDSSFHKPWTTIRSTGKLVQKDEVRVNQGGEADTISNSFPLLEDKQSTWLGTPLAACQPDEHLNS